MSREKEKKIMALASRLFNSYAYASSSAMKSKAKKAIDKIKRMTKRGSPARQSTARKIMGHIKRLAKMKKAEI